MSLWVSLALPLVFRSASPNGNLSYDCMRVVAYYALQSKPAYEEGQNVER
jgi:hypothetical protein